ncbi:MAG: hypothetical protein HP493_10520 [Nitrospira sp.]|nr:hypothetical protein [Nitrospira sp.]
MDIKMPDMNANDIEGAKKIVSGTARSMGVDVVGLSGGTVTGPSLFVSGML